MMSTVAANRPSGRLPEMNWIRGFAALMIMLYHYTSLYSDFFSTQWLVKIDRGWGAVSTFYVLSGFLTVCSLKNSERVLNYVWKRIKRLYPAYWVCIVLTAVSMYFFLPSRSKDIRTIAINFTMLQWVFGVADVDAAYWTMQFELKFYAFIAILLLIRQQKNIKWYTLLWVLVSFVFYSLFNLRGITRRLVRLPAIWLMVENCAPFASGVFLACIHKKRRDISAWVCLLFSLALCLYTQSDGHIIGHFCAVIAIGASVMLRSSLSLKDRYMAVVNRLDRGVLRPLAWFASISYPFYLLHKFIGWAVLQGIESVGFHGQWIIVFPFAVCTLLAWLVHHFVEQKVR